MSSTTRNWLYAGTVAVVVALVVGFRIVAIARLAESDPEAAMAQVAVALGTTGVVVLFVVIVLLVLWQLSRARRSVVETATPDAIVLDATRAIDTTNALRLATGDPALHVPQGLAVSADRESLSLWGGGADARALAVFPWSRVTGLEIGSVRGANGIDGHGLIATVQHDNGIATVPIQITGRGFLGLGLLTRETLADKVAEITAISGKVRSAASNVRTESTLVARRFQLLPGWSASRLGAAFLVARVLMVLFATALVILLFLGRVSREDVLPLGMYPFVAAVVTLGLLGYVLALLMKRRSTKESAAGYTTLMGGDLNLPQVDDVTGKVVREAGEPLLTKAEFKLIRERARLLP